LKFRQDNMLSYQDTANHFRIINPIIIANWQRKFDEKCRLDIDNKQIFLLFAFFHILFDLFF
ncbi:hypothetical protein KJC21_12990, partial [Mammaliicoccus sciuri]|nr:hypothetical protein [Mammaliicoccus sciuri]